MPFRYNYYVNSTFSLASMFYLCHPSGTSADIMKVGGYKLSALEIESVLLEVSNCFLFQFSMRTELFIFV